MNSSLIVQFPSPGAHRAMTCGDSVEFRLRYTGGGEGTAWLRTNLGAGVTGRAEIIAAVEQSRSPLARDWRDWPMTPVAPGEFTITVPLTEVGHFDAKTYYLRDAQAAPEWPEGENVSINVAPAQTVGGNAIYNAFVRQFGTHRPSQATARRDYSGVVDARKSTVLGPSGTFRDVVKRLDVIIDRLGCRYLLLLPIHPVPAVYGRMGLYGSPYAATDFLSVEPSLAEFDRVATPMDQFRELVDAVHRRQAFVLLDVAINHCGWAASIHARHPEWVVRDPDGSMQSPGAWGITWEDLTALDFSRRDLWRTMAEVLLFWCRRGVDGFRCDAGYMIPFEAWVYIIAKVRDQYPDTLFLLEGLGGKVSVTRRLLQQANFNWAYSELFQQYSREQVETYLDQAQSISHDDGCLVNFAETHDNNRLASQSCAEAQLRTAMAALLSDRGAFAFANGVEWFATEKIDVHGNNDLNWGAAVNQVNAIGRLNRLLRGHPAFYAGIPLRWVHHHDTPATLALLRGAVDDPDRVLVLVNLNTRNERVVSWAVETTGIGDSQCFDLLRQRPVTVKESDGHAHCLLAPGAVLCLSRDPTAMPRLPEAEVLPCNPGNEPPRVLRQRAVAKILEVRASLRQYHDCCDDDPDDAAMHLLTDPERTVAGMFDGEEDRWVLWQWPRDLRRQVMVPPGHLLLVRADAPFRLEVASASDRTMLAEISMPAADGTHFALIARHAGGPSGPDESRHTLRMRVFTAHGTEANSAVLWLLPEIETVCLPVVVRAPELPDHGGTVLRTNRLGAMLRVAADWGTITSRYDAVLAANLHPTYPVDRHVLLTRYRAWIEYRGHSHALNRACMVHVDLRSPRAVCWRFCGPFAPPDEWQVDLTLTLAAESNAVRLTACLTPAPGKTRDLPFSGSIDLVLRPDIEDRNFHEDTLAYTGPERTWGGAVLADADGFQFLPPSGNRLRIKAPGGCFIHEAEWLYHVPHPVEASRGMRGSADLFSPGYFRIPLAAGTPRHVDAVAGCGAFPGPAPVWTPPSETDAPDVVADPCLDGEAGLERGLAQALRAYIARRGEHKTVIAGFPWFLDWGRDTLIVARGMIAAGFHDEVEAILHQFAQFEDRGTLPNMIRGNDARDRDTSDAPLWFITACADLVAATGDRTLLTRPVGERTLFQVVQSIVEGYRDGTPNGIRVDPETGLVFSPAHFTWMDTNYPAATPRQGYPVEIQALWYAALRFVAEITHAETWRHEAFRVRQAIMDRFYLQQAGYFSDCLHAQPGESVRQAEPDDALRPNQLFLLTLDAVHNLRRTGRQVLAACGELVVPGGMRSLADRPVTYALPVNFDGRPLNDPRHPYWGHYEGDEDTRRKPAYHNGTAWGWLYPAYVEAWWKTYGHLSRPTVMALLGAAAPLLRDGCLLQLPELLDGDAPHQPRGCDAQAWSVSELYRVLRKVRDAS